MGSMKRAIYEWTAIFAAMLATASLGAWVFSCFSDAADVDADLVLGEPGAWFLPRASMARGHLEFFSDAEHRDFVLYPPLQFRNGLPPVATQHTLFSWPYYARVQEASGSAYGVRLSAPGMTFAYCDVVEFSGDPIFVWQVRTSLLWVFALASALTILATWRYRVARRRDASPPRAIAA